MLCPLSYVAVKVRREAMALPTDRAKQSRLLQPSQIGLRPIPANLVLPRGFEPRTCQVETGRSVPLSYGSELEAWAGV